MKKKLLSAFMGLILSLVVLEVALRVYNPLEFSVKGDNIVLAKNKTTRVSNHDIPTLDREIVIKRNKLGFRGENPPRNLGESTSIIAVGGSTTACFYVTEGKTWPALLGKKLKQDLDHVWLNNAGLDGHSTFGHLVLLKNYLVKIRPDYILFLVGCNDVGRDDLNHYDASILKSHAESTGLRKFVSGAANYSELVSTLLNVYRSMDARKHQLLHRQIDLKNLDRLQLSAAAEAKAIDEQMTPLRSYGYRLRELAAICRSHGITPIFVTQPALYGDAVDEPTGVDLGTIKMNEHMNGHLKWKILQLYNRTTEEVASDTGSLCIDLGDEMPKSSAYFYDYHHFTNAGCERVAEILADRLVPYFKSQALPQQAAGP